MPLEDDYDQEKEDVVNMVRAAGNIAINSYRRTRPFTGFPSEKMTQTLQTCRNYRNWLKKVNFPVSTENLDKALSALSDSILDFRRTGGIFEPARREGGADPRSAEHLGQFAQFLHRRINQPLVYGKQWAEFGKYWDEFMEDLQAAYRRWEQSR